MSPMGTKRSSSSSRLEQLMKEKIKKRLPQFFGFTSDFIDRMCCCSYVGSQANFDEVPEISLSASFDEGDNSLLMGNCQEKTTDCSDKFPHDESCMCLPGGDDSIYLDGSRGVIHKTTTTGPHLRSSNNSCHTISTASSSVFWDELEDDENNYVREITLPSVSSKTFTPRASNYSRRQQRREQVKNDKVPLGSMGIRQVQTESLTELPFLSMTEGYEC